MNKGNKMTVDVNDLLGDQYIGDETKGKEPQLTEFAKTAIELKSKLLKEAEKPRDNSRQEIARCDNLYIKMQQVNFLCLQL